jgi:predicted transcriptional regulator
MESKNIDKEYVNQLYEQGLGYSEIGKILGITRQYVHRIVKKYNNSGRKHRKDKYANFDKCNRCGSPPTCLHHKDMNNQNDSSENLEPLCNSCHAKEHSNNKRYMRINSIEMKTKRFEMLLTPEQYERLETLSKKANTSKASILLSAFYRLYMKGGDNNGK